MQNNEILEAVGDDDWRPTARDIRMLNQGRKPAWAKKVTEIGPRKARPRTSTSPSELAMRRVTEPDYRKPFSETDLKKAREGEELMNARIADRLQKAFDDFTVSITADEISVNTPTVRFKVIPYGPVYKVKTIYSATRSEMDDCESLYQVIELIKKNSQNIGESMNVDGAIRYMRGDATLKEALLDEALETLKNIGATITEDTDDWDDADRPAGMSLAARRRAADNRDWTRDDLETKRARAGIWVIKVIVSSDAYDEEKDEYVDDYTLGYLKPDGTVSKTYDDKSMLNYRQCQELIDKYARYPDGPAKPSFEKKLLQQYKITDKQASIFLSPGTVKEGKFHLFNSPHGHEL
jgi:hypothetical protein